jgi:hypothetical protein
VEPKDYLCKKLLYGDADHLQLIIITKPSTFNKGRRNSASQITMQEIPLSRNP